MGNFERIRYPDGQISAKFSGVYGSGSDSQIIKERINSYEDLFYIRSIADLINSGKYADNTLNYRLFIPCMFGQRSDRRFSELQSFDLKLITDMINACNFANVSILDPHSDVCLGLVNRSIKVSPFEYVSQAVVDVRQRMCNEGLSPSAGDILLVSPDAGAYKKVFEFGAKLNLPVMGAMKHRDTDGTIAMSFTHDVEGKDCLIVDDYCDGGATFTSLATLLRVHKARKVYLYVTHGLFSKGLMGLFNVIDHIYCTNSIHDLRPDEWLMRVEEHPQKSDDFVTQYKVI